MDISNNSKFGDRFPVVNQDDEPYPSLSDPHDYEPNLEFDDTEVHEQCSNDVDVTELLDLETANLASPDHDFSDDNFEDFVKPYEDSLPYHSSYPAVDDVTLDKYADIAKYNIVDVKGDDSLGRKLIVVYACRLPPSSEINHSLLLSYLTQTLDNYVEQDYSLVYFHHGLSSKNKPSLTWIVQAYKAFDRKYKKNLKALYLVHPTSFLRIVSQLFRPLISAKFGKKINYVSTLKDLNEVLPLNQLDIPEEVKEYDTKLYGALAPQPEKTTLLFPPTQQFGVSLSTIAKHYGQNIPPIVRHCIEYLDQPDALETEGIFRRSANILKVRHLKNVANLGQVPQFDDPHESASLLKTFLRELKEPLLTYELYDEIVEFKSLDKEDQLKKVSNMILENLPGENYDLLKYILSFLSRVMERADLNKMNAQNLSVVFGPNLVWPENGTLTLQDIGPINVFAQYLLQHHNEIFII